MKLRAGLAIWVGGTAMVVGCEAARLGVDSTAAGDDDAGARSDADSGTRGDADSDGGHVDSAPAEDADAATGQAAMPTFAPADSVFVQYLCVTLASTTPDATIHYTVDGAIPTASSPTYTTGLGLWSTATIRAIATAPGLGPSAVAVKTYAITKAMPPPAPVSFSPEDGTYPGAVDVSLSSTVSPRVLCFTLDGSVPTCSTQEDGRQVTECTVQPVPAACTGGTSTYDGSPLHLTPPPDGGTVTLRARTCVDGYRGASEVTHAIYTFSGP